MRMPVCYVVVRHWGPFEDGARESRLVAHEAKATYPNTADTRCGAKGLLAQEVVGHAPRVEECPVCRAVREYVEADRRLDEQGVPRMEDLLDRALYPGLLGLE